MTAKQGDVARRLVAHSIGRYRRLRAAYISGNPSVKEELLNVVIDAEAAMHEARQIYKLQMALIP
jgi:hypothetical protein